MIVNVLGDFDTLSVYCYHHGYMGGENLLKYKSNCDPFPFPGKPIVNLDSSYITIEGENYVVNTVNLQFTDNVSNILSNTFSCNINGIVYQHQLGSATTPNPGFPELEYDSYFACGDYNNSVSFTETPPPEWNNLNNIVWFSTGLSVNENEELKILQLTLSTDSNGTINYYYADETRNEYVLKNLTITNGIIIEE